jgi:outer membrane biosynthesis protein TonB
VSSKYLLIERLQADGTWRIARGIGNHNFPPAVPPAATAAPETPAPAASPEPAATATPEPSPTPKPSPAPAPKAAPSPHAAPSPRRREPSASPSPRPAWQFRAGRVSSWPFVRGKATSRTETGG